MRAGLSVLQRAERALVMAVFGLLTRRGWLVQLNRPEDCRNVYEQDGKTYDAGWRPFFSVRFGKTPVYRGPGEVRWRG